MNTNLEQSSTSPQPLPSAWIERLFERMSGYYGARFADAWRGIDPAAMKRCWAEELAVYSGDEIATGVRELKTRDWPPTLPEFLKLCRPVIDARAEWDDAREQMRIRLEGRGADVWSRPQVYWAAVAIGAYDLNSTAWEQIKTRWANALTKAKADPIPEYLAALPAPGRQTVTREEAADRLGELRSKVEAVSLPGTTKAGTQWANNLMAREAAGQQVDSIAAQFWREALGYPKDMDAKKALEGMKAKAA